MDKHKQIVAPITPDDLANLETIKMNMANTKEIIKLHAEMLKTKFDELVKQGFTESQAIELCKGNLL